MLQRVPIRSWRFLAPLPSVTSLCRFSRPSDSTTHCIEETQRVVQRFLDEPQRIKLRKSLENDPRFRISRDEYFVEAKKFGLQHDEAEKFLNAMDAATVVMITPQASEFVFLKPERLAKHLIDVIDPEATELQQKIRHIRAKLQEQEIEKRELEAIKRPMDLRAERATSRLLGVGLVGMMCHLGIVARLTWWELSWDIVEPITYLITYSTATLMFIYFCTTRVEYNYESLYQRMVRKRQRKIYERQGFDDVHYRELCQAIEENKKELLQLGDPWTAPPHAILSNPDSKTEPLITPNPSSASVYPKESVAA